MSVSVVIPTYNGAEFIGEAIDSVLAQTLNPNEILVVDDASTDETVSVVEGISRVSRIPIRILRLPENTGGPATPINKGIQAAQCEYVALLDQDDIMLPEKLARQSEVLRQYPQVDLVLSDYEHFDDKGRRTDNTACEQGGELHRRFVDEPGGVKIIEPAECLDCFARKSGLALSCSNQMFRKTMWARAGGFSALATTCTDHEFLFRAIRKPVAWIDQQLFRKRVHKGNLWEPSLRYERICIDSQHAASMEIPGAHGLQQYVINASRGLAWAIRRQNGEARQAFSECRRLVKLGMPHLAALEGAKTLAYLPKRMMHIYRRRELENCR